MTDKVVAVVATVACLWIIAWVVIWMLDIAKIIPRKFTEMFAITTRVALTLAFDVFVIGGAVAVLWAIWR